MAKSKKMEENSKSQHCEMEVYGDSHNEEEAPKKKEWEDAVCSVCLEFPHNAVLLLCSSYDNGCRPYMCATSHQYSNCLEQYMKAYAKVTPNHDTRSWLNSTRGLDLSESDWKSKIPNLHCPLCRGQVKGCTLLEPARRYLNAKKRTCMEDNCSFLGNYKELIKHVKLEHPLARPRDVDPSRAEKWKKLESERDLTDVMSTIRSTMPGATVVGDYVIERNARWGYDTDDSWDYGRPGNMYSGTLEAQDTVAYRQSENNPPRQRVGLLVARRPGRLRGQLRAPAAPGNVM